MRRTFSKHKKYKVRYYAGHNAVQKRFRGIIITRPALILIGCILSLIVFVVCAQMFFNSSITKNKDDLLKAGISNAMPFLSVSKKTFKGFLIVRMLNINFDERMAFVRAVPYLTFVNVKKEKIKLPLSDRPTPNISETSDASEGIELKNETSYKPDINRLLNQNVKFDVSPDKPSVLIVHTHASESYTPSVKYNYTQSGNYRTQNTNFNMIRVGEVLKDHLESGGIKVIHDKSINDYPSYNSSYNKTEKVIRENLISYPSIKMVFDIHRDAVGDDEHGIKFSSEINGKKAAQVMIVCGSDTNLSNPLWETNFAFALKIQKYFELHCPKLLRPLDLRKERFNMHLTTGSLLLEIGTNYNTLDEAIVSAGLLGDNIADIIRAMY